MSCPALRSLRSEHQLIRWKYITTCLSAFYGRGFLLVHLFSEGNAFCGTGFLWGLWAYIPSWQMQDIALCGWQEA